jgi:hypothetical protein
MQFVVHVLMPPSPMSMFVWQSLATHIAMSPPWGVDSHSFLSTLQ